MYITYFDFLLIISIMTTSEAEENFDAEKGAMIKKTWQLLAPTNFPGGRRVEAVTPNGNVIFVRVPEPGVQRGATFVAEEIPKPQPVMERWHDGICDCGSEGGFCCIAVCVHPIAWAYIMDKIRFSFLGYINPALRLVTFVIVVGGTIVLGISQFQQMMKYMDPATIGRDNDDLKKAIISELSPKSSEGTGDDDLWMLLGMVATVLSWYLLILFTLTRRAIRKMYKIRGNCFTDFLWVWCLPCCTPLQIYRHMRRSGEDIISSCDCGAHNNRTINATEIV